MIADSGAVLLPSCQPPAYRCRWWAEREKGNRHAGRQTTENADECLDQYLTISSWISCHDAVQHQGFVIVSSCGIWKCLVEVSVPGWTWAQRPAMTLGRTAGVAAEVWQSLQFPCNCLLMTCTAVRSGGNVLNNVTWQARLSLSDWAPKPFSSTYFIFYCLIVRVRLDLPFQSFSICNRSYSVLTLRLPIARLRHDKNLAKSQALFLAAVHRHSIYMDCNISSINLIKTTPWIRNSCKQHFLIILTQQRS